MRGGWKRFLGTVGFLVALGAAPAQAAPPPRQMSVSVTPAAITYPGQSSVSYRVEATAATAVDTVFLLSFAGPVWPGPVRPQQEGYLGSPLVFGAPTLDGPGTVAPEGVFPILKRDNFIEGPCIRGGLTDAHRWPAGSFRITVPAGTTTTLGIPATIAAPPRLGMSWATGFSGSVVDPAYLDPIGVLSEEVPLQVNGPVGVDVDFNTRGKRLWQLEGRSPKLRGFTSPPIRNRTVHVRAIPTGKKATRGVYLQSWRVRGSVSLGNRRTDSLGRFALKSRRMPMNRYYRIMVRYEDPGDGLVADWDCGPTFNTWRYDP